MPIERRRHRALLCALVLVVGLSAAGCSSSSTTTASQSPASAASTPAPSAVVKGFPLSAYGIHNGPSDFRLPGTLTIHYVVDQPNVVTLMLDPRDGAELATWLTAALPQLGYQVQGSSPDSVVFSGSHWSGAFTSDAKAAGITLRRN